MEYKHQMHCFVNEAVTMYPRKMVWVAVECNIVRVVVRRMKYNGGGGYSSAIERMLCKLSAESFFRPSSYMMKKVFPPLLFSYNQYRDLMTRHEGKTMSSYVKGIPGNCGS